MICNMNCGMWIICSTVIKTVLKKNKKFGNSNWIKTRKLLMWGRSRNLNIWSPFGARTTCLNKWADKLFWWINISKMTALFWPKQNMHLSSRKIKENHLISCNMRFEVFRAVKMSTAIFWVVTPCSFVNCY